MRILIDESGDLGWTFDKPFRQGGSSRFLTLAFLILPTGYEKRPRKIMRALYENYGWQGEKKASDATGNQKNVFCQKVVKLVKACPEIKLEAITANKQNVMDHIRQDANKLYNYMAALVIPDYVKHLASFELIPDVRSIKVRSQNSLGDYLQIKLWFDFNAATRVIFHPDESW